MTNTTFRFQDLRDKAIELDQKLKAHTITKDDHNNAIASLVKLNTERVSKSRELLINYMKEYILWMIKEGDRFPKNELEKLHTFDPNWMTTGTDEWFDLLAEAQTDARLSPSYLAQLGFKVVEMDRYRAHYQKAATQHRLEQTTDYFKTLALVRETARATYQFSLNPPSEPDLDLLVEEDATYLSVLMGRL